MTAAASSPVPGLSGLTVIARGGYSTVYRARQDSMGREIALKIDTRTLDDERDRRRFLREAEAAGRMSGHPHIVHVYDAGVTPDNHPFLVMELCTGGSFASKVKKNGPMAPAEVLQLGIKIADALDAAHKAGILHRDVKPANILINRYGVPGLADFGLAAVFEASRDMSVTVEALTPAYAAPEVFRLERPTTAGDIYSLAATLYALMAGKPPRWPDAGSPSPVQMVTLHNNPIPDIPGVPPGLLDVLRRGMASDPRRRFASAAQFRDALVGVRLDAPSYPLAPHPSPGGEPGPGSQQPVSGQPHQSQGPQASGQSLGSGPLAVSGPVNQASPAGVSQRPPHDYAYPGPHLDRPVSPGRVNAPEQRFGGPMPPTEPGDAERARRTQVALLAVLSTVLAVVLVVGGVLVARGDGGGPSEGKAPSSSPSPMVERVRQCLIETRQVRCPSTPECFDKITVASGFARARDESCTRRHTWETFAIAEMPESLPTAEYDEVRKNRFVRALCSVDNMALQLGGPTDGWEVEILPPSRAEFETGSREFRCVAGRGEDGLAESFFDVPQR